MEISSSLPTVLLPWYQTNKRDLPWRKDQDPYHIWVSEIMLQQTRVEAVKEYYTRFLDVLPTISALADCDDTLLHKLWEGLGYYSRVRNLKKAAQIVMNEYSGVFPSDYPSIHSLPGIGDYTCGAISSIAFNQPTPAVDGNVLRVISRLENDFTPIDSPSFKKDVAASLASIYPADASSFTQALMELGATICGPNRKPNCDECPCSIFCKSFRARTQELLPVKSPKKGKTTEKWSVAVMCSPNGKYALLKRPKTGLLADLWQFPTFEGTLSLQEMISLLSENGIVISEVHREVEKTHVFTHKIWDMRGFFFSVANEASIYDWFLGEQIDREIALPTAFRQFWDDKI